MNLLTGKIKPIYFKYLAAAFGSAMITSVYSIVDTAMVGQYQGPEGTAALAVVAPVWNIIYSLGLLMGIGGSVIFSTKRGNGRADGSENRYFTASVIGSLILAAAAWIGIICFEAPILTFFGADKALLPLAAEYVKPVKFVFPLFLFNQMLAAFLRNDNNPGLATVGVLSGGIFNVFGDYFFVFTCDMGIYGAGLATAIGSGVSFVVMLRQYNQVTMLPIAENLSDYFVSSFEIRQYSCTPRLHKRKNFLAMGQRFCKKTVLLSGAAPDRRILTYCERRATMPITAPFLQKSIVP